MKTLYTKEQFDNAKTEDKLSCECLICKNIFYKSKREINRVLRNYHPRKKSTNTTGSYCSKQCYTISQTNKECVNCITCNKQILRTPSQIKNSKSGHNFCSRHCSVTYHNTHKTTGNRRSKLESWLESKLISLYPDQKILFNDKTTINSELDIYFPYLKLAFELNGIFHYEPIFGIDKLNQVQNNDNRKFQACIEREIGLCIIDSSLMKNFKEQKYDW